MFVGQPLNLDNELTLFIHDALRFISAFIIPISQSAPHVYLSALPFAPEQSHVARKFGSRFCNTLVVTEGKPSQWPMAVFTAEHHNDSVYNIAFSPDQSTFLSASSDAVYICDSETGHCISGPFEIPGSHDACFSPGGKHTLFKFDSYAVVWDIEMGEEQFRIKGDYFAFVRHDGRIVSVNKEESLDDSRHKGANGILIQFLDASNGALISNRLLEANDVGLAGLSPDGHFLAIGKKSEDVIELWNLEGSKDVRRFTYPHGNMLFLRFSPTSDTLMVASREKPWQIYLWRLETQEMVSFSYDLDYYLPHVIHSPLANHLFIDQDYTVEIWDVSATGSEMIWEIKATSSSRVCSICPSHSGDRVLVGYFDGSVRMWNMDLENLAINEADTMDTRDGTDVREVIRISPSGKIAVTRSQQSSSVEFLDTTSGEVVVRTDIKYDDMQIAFSQDEGQVAFLSKSLITICDVMHPEKCVSFDPWPRKDVQFWKVAFQTSNDLVICATFGDRSALLQVWHRQDPAGFEYSYSLHTKPGYPLLAPDGLTIIIASFNPPATYSWNHETAQFDPVHFDDQEYIRLHPSLEYSPDGKLFACWSNKDSHVRVWDTRTRQLVSKFSTSDVHKIALSPALIDHPPAERLIALLFGHENAIRLFDAYTGHLHAQIMGQVSAYMAFIRDGTALAYYSPKFGLRTWDIADVTAEHWHSTMRDGWVMVRIMSRCFGSQSSTGNICSRHRSKW